MKGLNFSKIVVVLVVFLLCSSLLPSNNGISIVQAQPREIRIGLYFGSTGRNSVTLSTEQNTHINFTDGQNLYTVGEYPSSQVSISRVTSKRLVTVYENKDLDKVKEKLEELKDLNPILIYDFNWYLGVESGLLDGEEIDLSGYVEVSLNNRPVFYFRQINSLHGVQIHSDGEFIRLFNNNNERYRGFIEVSEVSGRFRVVNQLDLELYLRGVVPYEMSPSWPVEALKAQAVAARTYAIRNWNKYSSQNFNLCNTTTSQVYKGYNPNYETARVVEAVEGTRGEIITYNGFPIDAVYHSHSGGHTENSENVWVSSVAYLRGKPDPFSIRSGSALDRWVYDTVLDGTDSFGRTGFRSALLERNLIPSNFEIADITLNKSSSGGTPTRVTQMIIHSTDGRRVTLSSSQIWNLLYSTDSSIPTSQRFWSRMFDVELEGIYYLLNSNGTSFTESNVENIKTIDKDGYVTNLSREREIYVLDSNGQTVKLRKTPTRVKFIGSGWGHGVGMSQWGARQMAVEGYNYAEILKYYYTGIAVGR